MNCPNCGAQVGKNDSICKTCNFSLSKGSRYDIVFPLSTNNSKVIDLISSINRSDKHLIEKMLKRPRYKFISSITLSEAVKIERMFSKIGYKVELVKIKESLIPKRSSSSGAKVEKVDKKGDRVGLDKVESKESSSSFKNILLYSFGSLSIIVIVTLFALFTPKSISSNVENFFEANTDPTKIISGEKKLYRDPDKLKSFYKKSFNKHFTKSGKDIKGDDLKLKIKSGVLKEGDRVIINAVERESNRSFTDRGVVKGGDIIPDSLKFLTNDRYDIRYNKIITPTISEGGSEKQQVDFISLLRDYITSLDSSAVVDNSGGELSIVSSSGKYKDLITTTCSLVSLFFERDDNNFNINFTFGEENHSISSAICVKAGEKHEEGSKSFEFMILNNLQ